jgi:hypothetical protein
MSDKEETMVTSHLRLEIRWRRLVRDYETRLDVSKAMIQITEASLAEQQPLTIF